MLKHLSILLMLSISIIANINHRADSHAPIGFHADHTHQLKTGMVSYRIMPMQMNTLINKTDETSVKDTLSQYMMSPQKMNSTMHMLGGMWGLNHTTTLTAMIGYTQKEMTTINQMDQSNTETTSGFGDLKLGAIINLKETQNTRWVVNTGVSLPIGSITESNTDGTHLPYGMQLGSGTFDLMVGTSVSRYFNSYSLGGQLKGTVRTGKNKYNYRLGNTYQASVYAQKKWSNHWVSSVQSSLIMVDNINGSDSSLSSNQISMSPAYQSNNGRTILDVGLGGYYLPKAFKKTRIGFEYKTPLYYKTNTTQLAYDGLLLIGIQQTI